jgi:hypothetical protein
MLANLIGRGRTHFVSNTLYNGRDTLQSCQQLLKQRWSMIKSCTSQPSLSILMFSAPHTKNRHTLLKHASNLRHSTNSAGASCQPTLSMLASPSKCAAPGSCCPCWPDSRIREPRCCLQQRRRPPSLPQRLPPSTATGPLQGSSQQIHRQITS